MSTNEVMKRITDSMKSNGATADQIAKMEIAIQYIGNHDFHDKLNEYVFSANYHKQQNGGEKSPAVPGAKTT